MILWLETDTPFPDLSHALGEKHGTPGLLAAGADLSPHRLLKAYRHGIFPWFSEGQPILWWSTDPRMVLQTDHFRISRSLKKTLRKIHDSTQTDRQWQIRFDFAFEHVMHACAGPRRDSQCTWISDDIIAGYSALHRLGYAHSVEVWLDNKLVGGAYGVSIGRMFYGESMFSRVTDASKIALAYLVRFLHQNGITMIDCQQETPHLASLGAAPISRDVFMQHLRLAINYPQIHDWQPIDLFPA
ncbi:MAG: leucyl/phenylalanyl-tRNA--protein transferase [Glaciimonas sp.]|nr:leucyl/phenylalanyl-tRNA--protein transferase [Glaciimonas sp.]